ncbi:OLC1v1038334C1 [Oldenlandia corymbosa var. corymbosa]|uniref:OLC1v1038334C1 n=1 Tax=Oldenlandia corymbosa var. corymbosa TaxID=529605 RepID=A0AAV1D0R8_OLDCO|nr:OLC1v1038334C1 [Oldenlandia corymbosa var. corymbosa]
MFFSLFSMIKILVFTLASVSTLFYLGRWFLHRTALIHLARKWAEWIEDRIHVHQQLTVPQFNPHGHPNLLFRKVQLYLHSLPSLQDSDFINLFSSHPNHILLHLDHHQLVRDSFLGASLTWTTGDRSFLLRIKKKDKRRILRPYLQHIHTVADDIDQRRKELHLCYMDSAGAASSRWRSTPFLHPSTFDTLVMDPDLKTRIKSDLDTFLKSEHYYHKLGRVWKRSYLLYGPSGTGKSSFIAAMANYLSFDVYDLNLSRVSDDSDLKMLLLQITPKSIVVVEDLDFFLSSASGTGPNSGVTVSGLLNFMDGISNSCSGDEKIMVFTVSNDRKEDLEPAMLRPGRIDVHIHFPLCDFNSFKSLASNYLGLKEHKLFPQVEEMFQSGATISPAEIGELMLVHRSSPSRALKSVITALQSSSSPAGKNLRSRSDESTSSSPLPPLPGSAERGGVGVGWKDTATAKEFRKLYGILRLRSSKKSGPYDQDSVL